MEEERKEHEKGEAAAAGGIDEVLSEILHLLEDRLVQHDNNRQEVQSQLDELYAKESGYANSLEEKVNSEVSKDFNLREERILGIIAKLNEGGDGLDAVVTQAKEELSTEKKYAIKLNTYFFSFAGSYRVVVAKLKAENDPPNTNDTEALATLLQQHLDKIHESMTAVQNEIAGVCSKRQDEAADMKKRINEELETLFTGEDARLQGVLSDLRKCLGKENSEEARRLTTRAKAALVLTQKYAINKPGKKSPPSDCSLGVLTEESLDMIGFDKRKPTILTTSLTKKGGISVSFGFLSEDELELLKSFNFHTTVEIEIREKDGACENVRKFVNEHKLGDINPIYFGEIFTPTTTYLLRMKFEHSGMFTQWSDTAEFTTPGFKEFCSWKECPEWVGKESKYSVDENTRMIAAMAGYRYCTVTGSVSLPLNKIVSWDIKILKSRDNNGSGMHIGVAPFGVDQNDLENYKKCGLYLDCENLALSSGPPHYYKKKEYGSLKKSKMQLQAGDTVGVVMDTTLGTLSFVVNGVNYGIAYEGIPLDKPLVPCVIIRWERDSVELIPFDTKENTIFPSLVTPSNVVAESGDTWDSVTLEWEGAKKASFYQIEVDGSKFLCVSTTNTFTKTGLLPETEHSFRVRAVRGNAASEWSDVVKGRTQKVSFEGSFWKECPGGVDKEKKYSISYCNPRIATMDDQNGCCIIVGNTPIPPNKVTSWSVKLARSAWNNWRHSCVGVAPSDINQNEGLNFYKCGWYFYCYDSKLSSGPPHNYNSKEYGPRKGDGEYVHTGDSVGVIMDTTKGELSFALNGVNYGIAYEGIPLDKPLVPCAILERKGDSVELDTSEVNECVSRSISAPSKVTTTRSTLNSITLEWSTVKGASFYQIEVDGSKVLCPSTGNKFSKRGFLPETEHSFRVRAVKGDKVSKWSDVVKGRTMKKSLESMGWEECTEDVYPKYSIDEKNPRLARKDNDGYTFCTVIGNMPLPLNKVSSWSVKLFNLGMSELGDVAYVGVAPSSIDKNEEFNKFGCGWYLNCVDSSLMSGPPHDYLVKGYTPQCKSVYDGDVIGVSMDMAKGNLSFSLNGENFGVAYEGIPLDKPLVPCVLLYFEGESVELIT